MEKGGKGERAAQSDVIESFGRDTKKGVADSFLPSFQSMGGLNSYKISASGQVGSLTWPGGKYWEAQEDDLELRLAGCQLSGQGVLLAVCLVRRLAELGHLGAHLPLHGEQGGALVRSLLQLPAQVQHVVLQLLHCRSFLVPLSDTSHAQLTNNDRCEGELGVRRHHRAVGTGNDQCQKLGKFHEPIFCRDRIQVSLEDHNFEVYCAAIFWDEMALVAKVYG